MKKYARSIMFIFSLLLCSGTFAFSQNSSSAEIPSSTAFDQVFASWDKMIKIPVFEWGNPSSTLARAMENDLTYDFFYKDYYTPTIVDNELSRFRKGKSNFEVDLIHNGMVTTLKHEPASGYSEWTLPDFNMLKKSEGLSSTVFWHSIKIDFALALGTRIYDFNVPLQFRTSLSPSNKIEITLHNDASISFVTQSSGAKNTVTTKKHIVPPSGDISIEYRISSRGDWYILVNNEPFGQGTMDDSFFYRGLSNKFWFEGSMDIKNLAIMEVFEARDSDLAFGLSTAKLDQIDMYLARNFGKYISSYDLTSLLIKKLKEDKENKELVAFMSGDDEIYNTKGWRYKAHERTYVRRLGLFENDSKTVYRVGLLIAGTNEEGKSITVPMQYEVVVNESDKSYETIKLIFNTTEGGYILSDTSVITK